MNPGRVSGGVLKAIYYELLQPLIYIYMPELLWSLVVVLLGTLIWFCALLRRWHGARNDSVRNERASATSWAGDAEGARASWSALRSGLRRSRAK